MCSVIILRKPDSDWPFIMAANRDELKTRKWLSPGRHWSDRPNVRGGYDLLGGGSWLAINEDGVVATVLNRINSLGTLPGKRSRGELPLEAVEFSNASDAADKLSMIETKSYRGFNLIVADADNGFWLKSTGDRGSQVEVTRIPKGISMITAFNLNDFRSERIASQLPLFKRAKHPDPENDNWEPWRELLRSSKPGVENKPHTAMNIIGRGEFGTTSSSLIALPSLELFGIKPKWLFADGSPDGGCFQIVGQ